MIFGDEMREERESSTLIKTLVFVALLIGAGCFLGYVCGMIGEEYGALFSPSMSLLYLGLWFFGAVVVVAVTGGLVSVLIRPFYICAVAFALSALGMFATWGVSAYSGIAAAAYFLAGLLFCLGVRGDVSNRIKFSVLHILRTQVILLMVLVAIACASFYFGYAAQIEREGFPIPTAILDAVGEIVDAVEDVVEEQFGDLIPGDLDWEEIRADVEQSVENEVQPYARYIPMGAAAILFMPLMTIVMLLSWVPIVLLAAIFPLLIRFGVVEKAEETVEVTRLRI